MFFFYGLKEVCASKLILKQWKKKQQLNNTFYFCFQRSESWFSDGTEHSLRDEQDAALRSLPDLPYHTVSHFGQVSVLQSSEGIAVELAVKQYKRQWSHPCIISAESAFPRGGVWGRPSPAVRRDHGKVTCLRLLLLRVHCFCRLQSQEPLFPQRQTLLCSRQNSHCHCQNCCPHHL